MHEPGDVAIPLAAVPLVSILIPAKAEPDFLMAALRSLQRNGPTNIPFETIVVLDDPVAGLAKALDGAVRGVTVVASEVNLGLAGALNLGRAQARGELLIVLHDDAEIEPDWMETLVATAHADPRAGAIGGKVLFPDRTLQNAVNILWRDASTSPAWTGETPSAQAFGKLRPVDYCGSSSLLVRAAVWDAMGGIDERYFPAYYVDVDIAMSVRRLGYEVLYQPASVILHHRGASSGLNWRQFVSARNRLLFCDKWTDQLADHEPPDPDADEAVDRALARTALAAEVRRKRNLPLDLQPLSLRRDGEPAVLRQALEVTAGYVTWLEQSLRASADETEALRLELESVRRTNDRSRAGALYQQGVYLGFDADGAAYSYRTTGGHGREKWGTWLDDQPFHLVLPRPAGTGDDRRARLTLDAVSLIAGRRAESPFTVSINGAIVLDIVETTSEPQRYEAHFDLPDGEIAITISGGSACTPTSLNVGSDSRLLSVGLIGVQVDIGEE